MLIRRILLGVLTILLVSLLIFTLTELLPGDVASAVLGQQATPEALASIRRELRLDRPAPERYAEWLGHAVTGDLGHSLASDHPVLPMIAAFVKSWPISEEPITLPLLSTRLPFAACGKASWAMPVVANG
jgi:peptide/nickel transport system permease protein